ncbi:GLUG motif-containing protein, partial [uncultured Paracoccus sp.]|uniref:GLUG motif-containing protein n=1 Tax=uncultured Paracoccus sp. TaxID=189685 RepID=UPI0026294A6B
DNYVSGLFSWTEDAAIRNLTLTNVDIRGASVAGGIAGRATNTVLANVAVTGTVTTQGTDFYRSAGGLVGDMQDGRIRTASFDGVVRDTGGTDFYDDELYDAVALGGIIGRSSGEGGETLYGVSSSGRVLALGVGPASIGGIAGATGTDSIISNASSSSAIRGALIFGTQLTAGGLVGYGRGQITESSATGSVRSATGTGEAVNHRAALGGLIGWNEGDITDSFATGNVFALHSGGNDNYIVAGGFAGYMTEDATIERAFATGNVTVNTNDPAAVGGFVGILSGAITDAFASGDVRFTQQGTPNDRGLPTGVGGFAGLHYVPGPAATMTRTAAHGSVTAEVSSLESNVGGHTGLNMGGDIIDSYADGAVTASADMMQNVGGLVGMSQDGTIRNTYASGPVSASGGGSTLVGGLIGLNMPGEGGPTTTVTGSFYDRGQTGQAPNGLPGYGTAISTATFRDTAAFLALAEAEGWDFATVWAPGDSGAHPAIYTIDRVVFARPDDVSLQYGEAETTGTTGTTVGGPSLYVFAQEGDTLATGSVFDSLTFPSRNVGTGQFTLTTTSLTSAAGETYRVVDLPANYEITPAPLTIRANDQEKDFGDSFLFGGDEFTPSGLLYDDSVASVDLGSGGAGAGAAVGEYAIAASDAEGSGLSNYDITYVPGTMTVTAEPEPPTETPVTDSIPRPNQIPGLTLPNPPDTIDDGTTTTTTDPTGATSGTTGAVDTPATRVILAARDSASDTLAQVDQMSSVLEIAAASCSQSDADVSRYLACLSDALDDFANKLDEISTDLPPGMENVAEIVRDARRNIDGARARAEQRLAGATTAAEREDIRRDAINEARGAIATASAQIREAITLVRADDPELARIHSATINRVAQAVDNVGIEMSRAVGL